MNKITQQKVRASISRQWLIGSGLVMTLLAGAVTAAVSPDQAAKLGDSLTPVGAETAGNAAGTIPAWDGGIKTAPKGFKVTGERIDPYGDDKPLFTITAANLDQYKDNLTPGQIALLKRYPDTHKMHVYPTRRSAAYPQKVYDAAKKNATSATLVSGGNGIVDFAVSVPFPIPQTGIEAMWNHITRYRGGSVERTIASVPVQRNGDYTLVRIKDQLIFPEYLVEGYDAKKDNNILFYYIQKVLEPTRLTGNVLLVHETLDQVKEPRLAWVYNAGQRRVRRAPQVAYDGPGFASDGQRTSDNLDMFNGAPDKYNWKLVGKKEVYIPYNSFKLASKKLKYKDILKAGHVNPDHSRYELHRVWEIEGTLKDGERHIYSRRSVYLDEDSWQAAVVDQYDGRNELWRVSEGHNMQFYEVTAPWLSLETLHDLNSGRYMAIGLTNEEKIGFDFAHRAKHRDFTPAAIRRSGKR
ncbi:DUF1329 domain-containing protein [Neptunomonas japonica]|uniref:Outer membrane lipoprotein-sorting protein n=1 Tax=Neptunomonas japonica JAMM 1380 TaxID=1441457 RepID=A0A7R6PJ08_9GAMM|nr:DUF1329 domain-containing protein [Neptunomonas japonica]BBB30488.1 conserved hypothetical protein [Neptunomonas japonica JAMM 1380]